MSRSALARVAAALCLWAASAAAASTVKPPAWKQIEQLESAQKLEEAQAGARARLEAARAGKDEKDWTRAPIKVVQLEVGLHGYETAVRILKEGPWPDGAVSQATLQLFYAAVLDLYACAHGWEINAREKVQTSAPHELEAWTMDEVRSEANRAHAAAWKVRASLGREPITALGPYLHPNDYPKGIRDTLRDAVSYQWVEQLADTRAWRPEHAAGVYQLELSKLLGDEGLGLSDDQLADPSVHPLLKIAAILSDLEAWHTSSGRRQGALEARIVRWERLHEAFSQAQDRSAVRSAAAQGLAGYRDVPWYSAGVHTLAQMWREDGNWAKAYQLAREGAAAYADSIGGRQCAALVREVAAPDLGVEAMSADGPRKRSIRVTHRNLPAVYFRAYAVDFEKRLTAAREGNPLSPDAEYKRLLKGGHPTAEWQVALPATPDFQAHVTYVTPPMTRPGLYIVLASATPAFNPKESRLAGFELLVTDLVLVTRQTRRGQVEATVVAGESGKAVDGATVELWQLDYQKGHHRVDAQTTDAQGGVVFAFQEDRQYENFALVAHKGAQWALENGGVSFSLWRDAPPSEAAALVFTDRGIYRPEQKVLWKVVAYRRDREARFCTADGVSLTVSLVDANGQTVETKEATANRFGSAAGEFRIPAGRVLGSWRIQTSPTGGASIRVEEYRRPTFETSLDAPSAALRLNQPATLVGRATYYFGLPVTQGSVHWRVTRQPHYPWWWSFWFSGGARPQVIATGEGALADDGTFQVSFLPQADERQSHARDVTYAYAVEADVTDDGGETRSASRSYRLGFVTVEAALALDVGFLREGAGGEVRVQRTSLDGAPRAGEGSWRLLALKQPARAPAPADVALPRSSARWEGPDPPPDVRTPGDRLRPRWSPGYDPDAIMADWSDGAQQAAGTLHHGPDGNAVVMLPALAAGAYRLRYQTVDEFGVPFDTFRDFVVAGAGVSVALPAVLWAERTAVKVGETARFVVTSGRKGQPLTLDVYRDGARVRRQELTAQTDAPLVEVPVTEKDRGGFTVALSAIQDFQLIHLETAVMVPWDDQELRVSFSTFRDLVRPGQKETWRVKVSSPRGKDPTSGAVEVLAYMFDRSLDAFGPHRPPSPLSLYPRRTGAESVRVSVGPQRVDVFSDSGFPPLPRPPEPSGDRWTFFPGRAIGGPGPGFHVIARTATVMGTPVRPLSRLVQPLPTDAAPQGPSSALELRSNFAETAFWKPQLVTGSDGSVSFDFIVPDSLTSWNVWAHAVTQDFRAGAVELHTRSVKDLMVRPYVPRFLREGDQAVLQVVVDNASPRALDGRLDFDLVDADTQASVLGEFQFKGEAHPRFSVGAGQSTHLTFAVTAPKRVGQAALRVAAHAGDFSDGELRPLPLLPSRLHLAQSRFVALHDRDSKTMTFPELADSGDPSRLNEQLSVTLDAQLFDGVLQALPYLVRYPYECAEQTLNRFVSTGIVSSLYQRYPAVQRMAQKMSARTSWTPDWDAADPNRKMAMEETPWVRAASGGGEAGDDAVNMLDSRIAQAERDEALAKLRKMQTASGGFPWFPGGPPSPDMTLYVLQGLARAVEFGIDVPKDVTRRGWTYLTQSYRTEWVGCLAKDDCAPERLALLAFTATAYPDASYMGDALTADERRRVLEAAHAHAPQASPYVKGLLALALARSGRRDDGMRVWASVMNASRTTAEEGTSWAREDRSWLWYNDTIESQAFALRTLMELSPDDARRHGLVQWLLLNRKLNHWKSTRATAEALYALVKYLQHEGTLATREDAHVEMGSRRYDFDFEPDVYAGGKSQIVLPGPRVDAHAARVTVRKDTPGLLFASSAWSFSTDRVPPAGEGDLFSVSRAFLKRVKDGREVVLRPLGAGEALTVGDELEVQLAVSARHEAEYVHLRDPRGAGLEPETPVSRYVWNLGVGRYEEVRDSGANFFFERLPAGKYTMAYRLRATVAGKFRVGPATLQSMYAPEFNAYSAGAELAIQPGR